MTWSTTKSVVKAYSKWKEEKPSQVVSQNAARHREAVYSSDRVRVMFKEENFKKFPQIYDHLEFQCPGASINLEELEDAIENGCSFIVTGRPDRSLYRYPARLWKKWAEEHQTIRETDSGEEIASIPLELMEKIALKASV